MDAIAVPRERLDPRFETMLVGRDVPDLEHTPWPAYGMWSDSSIAYYNPAYERQMTGPWGLGAFVLDSTGELRPRIEQLHADALATGQASVLRYECPTGEAAREFELRVLPVRSSAHGLRGLLAIHSLVVQHPHEDPHEAHDATYRDDRGLVRHCAYCRRTRRAGTREIWDVVPAYIVRLPRDTSHGICAPCAAHYFGRQD